MLSRISMRQNPESPRRVPTRRGDEGNKKYQEYLSESPSDTKKLVTRLAKQLEGGNVVGLIGPLGAGKTFIAQYLAKTMGIKRQLRSPSFTLFQPYSLPKPIRGIKTLVHVDAYRVTANQLLTAGLEDYLGSPNCLIIIEWADRLKNHLQFTYTWRITYGINPLNRIIRIS